MPDAPEAPLHALTLTPDGELLRAARDDEGLDPEVAARVERAFRHGVAEGLVRLAAVNVGALSPSLGWWRDVARRFLTRLRGTEVPEGHDLPDEVPLPEAEVAALLDAAPPMEGGEYLSAAVVERWWRALRDAVADALRRDRVDLAAWLHAQNPAWHLVGRVCFHLAERKGDTESPFAFLATYAEGISDAARVRHVPLGRALQASVTAKDRARLEALMAPVRRAAEESERVRAMLDDGALFRPLSWSAREAWAFLREVPVYEAAGVAVRVPDWWTPERPPRPVVRVTVGRESRVGVDALLDFQAELTLDGEPLTDDEVAQLRGAGEGLVCLRGRWVQVDAAQLEALRARWQQAVRAAREGVSFHRALRLLAGGLDDGAPSDEAAAQWSRVEAGPWLSSLLAELRDPSTLAAVRPGPAFTATLRPYQTLGLRWLWLVTRLGAGACLADDMGLGKTVQLLALLSVEPRPAERPSLLVAPASLLANWRAECERHAPGLRVKVLHPAFASRAELDADDPSRLRDVDLVVTSYGTLARTPWIAARRWRLAVLDEAQAIKNADTRQSRAARSLVADARVAMTGTPVENSLGDLWSLFAFLQPGLLGTAAGFKREVRAMTERGAEGLAPLRRLVRPWVLRRMKSDRAVAADLPDKTEVTTWCSLSPAQAALYQSTLDDLRRRLGASSRDTTARRGAVLAALVRLKQVCNHPAQARGDEGYAPEESGKFARLREVLETVAARGEKALVFTQFQEVTEALAAYLRGAFGRAALVLDGSTPVRERARRVARFQEDPTVGFFVLSLKAGGTGLNLTAAQHVVHFDRWWNPAVEDQATDRAYRIGQRRNVLVHRFVCRGTLEERIDEMLRDKRLLADAVVSSGAEVDLLKLSDPELLSTLSLDLSRALDAGD